MKQLKALAHLVVTLFLFALLISAVSGCSATQQEPPAGFETPQVLWQNFWTYVCANQPQYVQAMPLFYLNPQQATLALGTLCGTITPKPLPAVSK